MCAAAVGIVIRANAFISLIHLARACSDGSSSRAVVNISFAVRKAPRRDSLSSALSASSD
eukprot:138123-Pleurochrysis_carterae.AAC.1